MFRFIFTLAMLAGLCLPAAQANAAERKLLMSGFKDIVIEDDIAVELIVGKSPKAVAIGDRRELPRVLLERRGKALVVKLRQSAINSRRRPMDQPLVIKLQNYDLENVIIRGNGTLTTNKLSSNNTARVLISGSGALNVAMLESNRLIATIIGNGNIKFADGSVRDGLIEIQGGAIVDAGGVMFDELDITHQGNGETIATVKRAANITNNGRGRISITGSANCSIKQAGSAVIDCPKYGR